jgi:23S rRNA pseudouridine1911/1915/1917 synthase
VAPRPTGRTETWAVAEPERRLDLAIVGRLATVSRVAAQRLIRAGHVTVDGRPCTRPSQPVAAGTTLRVHVPPPEPSELVPEPLPLDLLYEDAHLLVVNKAPGVVVHPSAGHSTGTLVHGLLHLRGNALSGIGGVERPGIVHRLDRDTSGCMVIAKDDATHRGLVALFRGRDVRKLYMVLAWGKVEERVFRVDRAIGRSPHNRKKMAVRPDGREAVTEFRRREQFRACAWLEARLLTGRTHQIRVHLASTGHPVVGDRQYGRARALRQGSGQAGAPYAPSRQMLHAWRLAFRHPVLGIDVEAEAPVPTDFEEAVRIFRADSVAGKDS